MSADGGNPIFGQGKQDASCDGLVRHRFHTAENHWVVGHDQLSALVRRLPHHLLRDIQGHQDAIDGRLLAPDQKSCVVEPFLELKGGFLLQKPKYLTHCGHLVSTPLSFSAIQTVPLPDT